MNDTPSPATTTPHRLTIVPWYNSAPEPGKKPQKILAMSGSYESLAYGENYMARARYGIKPPHPLYGEIQQGIACSRSTGTIAFDVDDPEKFAVSATGRLLASRGVKPFSVRSDGSGRCRYLLDARDYAKAGWPAHGPAVWGDILSKGLCAMGTHYSGAVYPWPA
jgi:hypothetical protein